MNVYLILHGLLLGFALVAILAATPFLAAAVLLALAAAEAEERAFS